MDEYLINIQKNQKRNQVMNFISSLQIQKRNLESYRNELNASWRGDEMRYINYCIDAIDNEITQALKRCWDIHYYLQ